VPLGKNAPPSSASGCANRLRTSSSSSPSLRSYPDTGAWLIHVVLILVAIVLLETIPGMSQDLTWTIVNLGYLSVRLSPFLPLTSRRTDESEI
jgi:hypothetical protein